tara:strand:- start:116 stop:514 length:399 start_codon:yes stop_codon:yes gene_type:complete
MTLFFKKAWTWTKKHWYYPVLGLLFIILVIICPFCGGKDNKILQMFRASKESYEKEIDVIDKAEADKNKKKDELYQKYLDTMKKLAEESKVDMDQLSKEKKMKMDNMVKKYKGSPDDLAKDLSEMLGVDYVE